MLSLLAVWSPWASFLSECALMQLLMLLTFFYFSQSRSLFYSLTYLFILFIWLGLTLAYLGLELFTGFLWVVELSVFFILLLFLFFLNFGSALRPARAGYFKLVALALSFFFFFSDDYSRLHASLNFFNVYEDLYSASFADSMSDVHALFLSYYFFNSLLLLFFGFFIFLTSVICVVLLNASRASYASSIASTLAAYCFFSEVLNFELLRKQNLNNQVLRKPNSRLINKDLREWSKKKAS